MKVRGRFTVQGAPESMFETLVGVLGELKAKTSDIDTLRYRIDGKSKTTFQRWGTKFHVRVIKNFANTVVEVYDIAPITDDQFIKMVYKTFTKYQPASPLEIQFFVKIPDIKTEVDEYLDDAPLPAGHAPEMVADIPDDAEKVLPAAEIPCIKCGASNRDGDRFCRQCGSRLAGCPACGYVPEDDSSFCIKCGTKLA